MVKRAKLYLIRKYKRTILLFLLLFIVSSSITVGLSVWNRINTVTKEIQQTLGTSFIFTLPDSITQNDAYYMDVEQKDGLMGKVYTGPKLNKDVVAHVMEQVDGIQDYNAEFDDYAYVDDMTLVHGLSYYVEMNDPFEREISEMYTKTAPIYGNTNTALHDKFRTGMFELVEGRHITPTDVKTALISDEVAKLNGLHIGDTIHLSLRAGQINDKDVFKIWGESQEVEIVGIFHVNGYQPTGKWVSEMDITYNWIFTDISVAFYFPSTFDKVFYKNKISELRYRNVTFFVEDPDQLQSVIEQVRNLKSMDMDYYTIRIDDTMYKSTVDPLNTIRNLIVGSVFVIIGGCIVILCIVFTMWVHSRRREIAIYLSMGVSKISIMGQFVLEASIIAILSGVFSFAVCQKVPDMIVNPMLTSTITALEPHEKEFTQEELHQAASTGTMDELIKYEGNIYAGPDKIDFQLHITDFIVLIFLETLIIIAVICKSGFFIFKLQPRQIMLEFR